KSVRIITTIFLALVGIGFFAESSSKKDIQSTVKETKLEEKAIVPYSDYLTEVQRNISDLSAEQLKMRKSKLKELKENKYYTKLITDKEVLPKYIPILNTISDGISRIINDGFLISDITSDRLKKKPEAFRFALLVVTLAQPKQGGLDKEIIDMFSRYKVMFRYYGEPLTVYDENGENLGKIEYNYDFSSIFGMIDPMNEEVLNAVYLAKNGGYSNWLDDNENYIYPYLIKKREFNLYLKKYYPNNQFVSNVDYELTASMLFNAYESNEVAADGKYLDKRIAVTGKISDIGKDVLGNPYVSLYVDYMKTVNCYFSEDEIQEISQLKKGQKIYIEGICKGKTLNISVNLSDCKF
ncbi:MAG: OB-fold protein, partial [Polaribacter sp.]